MKTEFEEDDFKVSFKNVMLTLLVVFLVMILIYSSSKTNFSLLWLVLFFSIYITILSFRKSLHLFKYRKLIWVFNSFILIHLVIFPCIYVNILNDNSNSFEFDNYIVKNEKENSLNKIAEFYSPKELALKVNLIDSILIKNSKMLDFTLKYLESRNIVMTNEFRFFMDTYDGREEERSSPFGPSKDSLNIRSPFNFIICDSIGSYLNIFSSSNISSLSRDNSIKSFLNLSKDDFTYTLNNYNNLKMNIEKKNIYWTYDNLLPYSINIFNTSNINPKTRTSNYLVGGHKALLAVLLVLFSIVFVKK